MIGFVASLVGFIAMQSRYIWTVNDHIGSTRDLTDASLLGFVEHKWTANLWTQLFN